MFYHYILGRVEKHNFGYTIHVLSGEQVLCYVPIGQPTNLMYSRIEDAKRQQEQARKLGFNVEIILV